MSRELIVKEVYDIEEAIGRIEKQCFVRGAEDIEHLPFNQAKVYTRNHIFLLKLVGRPSAEWKVLK